MLELLLGLFGEFVLQVVGEDLVEVGLHAVAEPFQKKPKVWQASTGYALFGIVAGGVSLLAFPALLVLEGPARIANLLLTPVAVGACMVALGSWRQKRGQPIFLLNRFFYGFVFAAAIAVVRFGFGE
jgi:hypothetical protein